MTLSTLSILLGTAVALPHVYGLARPEGFSDVLKKLPRNIPLGFILMGTATVWFLNNLGAESIADFEAYKKPMLIAFGALGAGACIFVQDFLAVRGGAILMLLVARWIFDTARWHESNWRLVLVVWGYLMVLGGIWFTVSPWRVRDFIEHATSGKARLKGICTAGIAFGSLLVALGLMVF